MGNYLTILPLIALLLLDLLNSNLGPQLCKSNVPKWLGEDVPELSSCLDILEPDLSTIDAITDEVILGVDELAPVVVDGVLCLGDRGLVVHHQDGCPNFFSGELCQQPPQPNYLATCRRRRNVLCLASAQRNDLLFQRLPGDRARSKEEEHTSRAPSSINVARQVAVAEPKQLQLSSAPP